MSKNVQIAKYDIMERGKVRCYFNLTEDQWKDYKLEFNNSEIIKFKSFIDQLKDLAFVFAVFFIGF
jgi:hypothetical protein